MMLVTGGAGVLGSRLVRGLAGRGHRVRVLTLPGDPCVSRLQGVDCDIAYADVARAESLQDALLGVDTVYHLAAVILAFDPSDYERINVNGVRNMVEASVTAGVRHFVYVSSAAAAHPEGSAYAESKARGETIVKSQATMRYTIVRPTLIYDREGGQEFRLFEQSLLKYPVVPFVGSGQAKKNPVHSDDVVQALVAIQGNPRTYGKTYNLSGGEAIRIRDLARLLLERRGVKKPFVHVPVPHCRLLASVMERLMEHPPLTHYAISRILEDADLDHASATEDLGYRPIGISEGLIRISSLSDEEKRQL